jgi:hypothetical protein
MTSNNEWPAYILVPVNKFYRGKRIPRVVNYSNNMVVTFFFVLKAIISLMGKVYDICHWP